MAALANLTMDVATGHIYENVGAGVFSVLEHLAYMFYIVPWWRIETNLSDMFDYTANSTFTFLGLIGVEFILSLLKGVKLYRLEDVTVSTMLGGISILAGVFLKSLFFVTYVWIWEHFHIVELIPGTALDWIIALLFNDLCYYWMHRHAHEYHVFWWGHSVHHSGEDYNLATALRQGVMQSVFSWLWMLPGAFFLSPVSFFAHRHLNVLYQFWIHTTLIGRLGVLENVLNTPSHHRMHHRPPGNCNYAGVLIIWDRMFGTFIQEDEQKDYYGLAKQYETHDPVSANVEHARRVTVNVDPNKARGVSFYLKLLFKKRVKHKATFDPLVLTRPLKAPTKSLWKAPDKPRRKKLASNTTAIVSVYKSFFVVYSLITLLLSMDLVAATSNNLQHCIPIIFCMLLMCSSMGRLFDGFQRAFFINTFRVIMFLVLFYMMSINKNKIPFDTKVSPDTLFKVGIADALAWTFVCLSSYNSLGKTKND